MSSKTLHKYRGKKGLELFRHKVLRRHYIIGWPKLEVRRQMKSNEGKKGMVSSRINCQHKNLTLNYKYK